MKPPQFLRVGFRTLKVVLCAGIYGKFEIQPRPIFMIPPAGAGPGQKVASPAKAPVDP